MSERELTDWFPADVKPVWHGVYETRSPVFGFDVGWYSYWDGDKWGRAFAHTGAIGQANEFRDYVSCCQDRPWRGLRSPA